MSTPDLIAQLVQLVQPEQTLFTSDKPDTADMPDTPDPAQPPDTPKTSHRDSHTHMHAIQQVLAQAAQLEPGEGAQRFVEGALDICKQLYQAGRAFEAIPIARTGYILSARLPDIALQSRAATTCGLMLGDKGDYAGAIEAHITALKLAQQIGDQAAIARAWNNLGATFLYVASYDSAVEAFSRIVKQLRHQPPGFHLYGAYVNLAQCHLHLLDSQAGLSAAKKALQIESSGLVQTDPLSVVLLRRNYVRLLILANRHRQAQPLLDEVLRLSQAHPSPRIEVAVLVTRGIYEVACGHADVGLTRLRQALERVRKHMVAELRDTLICLVQAEEMAGRPDRAAFYLNELAATVYRETIEQVHKHLDLCRCDDSALNNTLAQIDDMRYELMSKGHSPHSIAEWQVFDRFSIAACLKIESSGLHGIRVGKMAGILAFEADGDPQWAAEIGYAARFHDIGMRAVPDSLLSKTEPLSLNEQALMQTHCRAGMEMLSASTHAGTMLAIEVAQYHHEWWNGQGYPHGISGNAIPYPARVCAVADVFDELMGQRSYHDQLAIDEASTRLLALAGTQLDPQLVDCFVKSLRGEGEGGIRRYLSEYEQPAPGLDGALAKNWNAGSLITFPAAEMEQSDVLAFPEIELGTVLKPREIEMLKTLVHSSANQEIACRFDITAATAGLCLSALYKKLNVKNRADAIARLDGRKYGEIALKSGLLDALGTISCYIGPPDPESRPLWEWLLAGDFGKAADYYQVHGEKYCLSPPPAAAPLAASLLLGGHLAEGQRLVAAINSGPEYAVLSALADLLIEKSKFAWFALCFASLHVNLQPAKQLAMVVLFHLYRDKADQRRARFMADAISDEARAARRLLWATILR